MTEARRATVEIHYCVNTNVTAILICVGNTKVNQSFSKHITLHGNGEPLLKWIHCVFTSKASSKVNLLNCETYRWDRATVHPSDK